MKMKFNGLFVGVINKSGTVYEVALTDSDKDSVLFIIQQLQNSKSIKIMKSPLPMKIDVVKMEKLKKARFK